MGQCHLSEEHRLLSEALHDLLRFVRRDHRRTRFRCGVLNLSAKEILAMFGRIARTIVHDLFEATMENSSFGFTLLRWGLRSDREIEERLQRRTLVMDDAVRSSRLQILTSWVTVVIVLATQSKRTHRSTRAKILEVSGIAFAALTCGGIALYKAYSDTLDRDN